LSQESLGNNDRKMYITFRWLSIHVSEMKEKVLSGARFEPASPCILIWRNIHYTNGITTLDKWQLIDVGRQNAANPRNIFSSRHLYISLLLSDNRGYATNRIETI